MGCDSRLFPTVSSSKSTTPGTLLPLWKGPSLRASPCSARILNKNTTNTSQQAAFVVSHLYTHTHTSNPPSLGFHTRSLALARSLHKTSLAHQQPFSTECPTNISWTPSSFPYQPLPRQSRPRFRASRYGLLLKPANLLPNILK